MNKGFEGSDRYPRKIVVTSRWSYGRRTFNVGGRAAQHNVYRGQRFHMGVSMHVCSDINRGVPSTRCPFRDSLVTSRLFDPG